MRSYADGVMLPTSTNVRERSEQQAPDAAAAAEPVFPALYKLKYPENQVWNIRERPDLNADGVLQIPGGSIRAVYGQQMNQQEDCMWFKVRHPEKPQDWAWIRSLPQGEEDSGMGWKPIPIVSTATAFQTHADKLATLPVNSYLLAYVAGASAFTPGIVAGHARAVVCVCFFTFF